ncbi:MAG TPA: DUF4258 domain-containing protein [Vicinamibacteria bacterium]|nr:DUF4258 domain-containing protein [Vicinamibacteria bacterium]
MRKIPEDPVEFIRRCVVDRKVYWTYHVNMRLAGRYLARNEILDAVESYEIVESYPEDKYLPSYLVLGASSFHVLFAVDVEGDNVRVVTAYRPDPDEWEPDLKTRSVEK